MVLRRTVNPFLIGNIGGSNPSPPTRFASVAQLVEHGIEDPGVGGSIPSRSTISESWLSGLKHSFAK